MGTFSTLRAANEARQREWDAENKISLAYRASSYESVRAALTPAPEHNNGEQS